MSITVSKKTVTIKTTTVTKDGVSKIVTETTTTVEGDPASAEKIIDGIDEEMKKVRSIFDRIGDLFRDI